MSSCCVEKIESLTAMSWCFQWVVCKPSAELPGVEPPPILEHDGIPMRLPGEGEIVES